MTPYSYYIMTYFSYLTLCLPYPIPTLRLPTPLPYTRSSPRCQSINHNYVYGRMSATIAWNLIAAHYAGTAYDRKAMMMANQPWSGHYEVSPPVWAVG